MVRVTIVPPLRYFSVVSFLGREGGTLNFFLVKPGTNHVDRIRTLFRCTKSSFKTSIKRVIINEERFRNYTLSQSQTGTTVHRDVRK